MSGASARMRRHWRRVAPGVGIAIALATTSLAVTGAGAATAGAPSPSGFNQPGNILITDQFNNEVVEINPITHQEVWHFGNGSPVPGPHSIVGTNDAERVGTSRAPSSAARHSPAGCRRATR